jgi:hypothetical protein
MPTLHLNSYPGKVHDDNGNLIFNIGLTSIKDARGAIIGKIILKTWSSYWLGTAINDKRYVVKSKGKAKGGGEGRGGEGRGR